MNCYRVVVFDEKDKVLISKIVTDEGPKEEIADRIRIVLKMHSAPFTVSVSDYVHDTMTCFGFMVYLDTALREMSLRGGEA